MFLRCWFRPAQGAALACISFAVSGQSPSFEVASVRIAAPSAGRGGHATASGDRVSYENTTVKNVLARAYGVKGYQIDGPSWILTERYDIVAKAPDDTPKEQIPLMLQSLLTERFQLRVHREERLMPAYELIAGKGAPKLQKSEGALTYDMSGGRRELKNHSIVQLTDFLSSIVQRPVRDKTGITGTYNFSLEMSLEELGGINAKPDVFAPSIFTIVEGLGLKLESQKAPIEVIVVDSGNKVPTEN
jgi:uncharacterized protein (TIGR03435 family)